MDPVSPGGVPAGEAEWVFGSLAGERVRLVAFEETDVARVASWINDERISVFNGSRFPVSLAEQVAWYRGQQADRSKKKLLIAVGDERVGMVSLFDIDPRNQRAEIGVYVAPDHQRRGYAADAVRLMLDFAFRELNLRKVHCSIVGFNAGSVRLFEGLGFRPEGVRRAHVFTGGRWADVHLMALFAADHR